MEIYMQKIGLIREDTNPKNTDLNLGIDWFVEYANTDQHEMNFTIVLKSSENFNLSFKVEGILKLDLFEKFNQEDVSQIVFSHACNVLMDMVFITRESVHILSGNEYSNFTEHVPDTLFHLS